MQSRLKPYELQDATAGRNHPPSPPDTDIYLEVKVKVEVEVEVEVEVKMEAVQETYPEKTSRSNKLI